MNICGTGHRLYDEHTRLIDLAVAVIERKAPTTVISGMALGWDMALAVGALLCGIPLVCAVPFSGQELRWKPEWKELYHKLLANGEVVVISEGGYSAKKMFIRNHWMVDNADVVWALYDGRPGGGTRETVQYAMLRQKPILNLWKSWEKYHV